MTTSLPLLSHLHQRTDGSLTFQSGCKLGCVEGPAYSVSVMLSENEPGLCQPFKGENTIDPGGRKQHYSTRRALSRSETARNTYRLKGSSRESACVTSRLNHRLYEILSEWRNKSPLSNQTQLNTPTHPHTHTN